jgi:hypothetical protein
MKQITCVQVHVCGESRHRRTVSANLHCAGIRIRQLGLDSRYLAEAVALYEAGWSSARLAKD